MAEPSRTRWGLVLVATGAGVIAAAHVGKVPAALPAIRAEFGLDLVAAGWVVSIFNATGMAGGMLAGVFADRIGHRRLALTGLAALLLGSLAGATAESGTVLLLTRFLEGLGFVTTAVSAPSIIANAAKHRDRRLALGLWGAYMPAGVAAMMLMSPALLAPFGWRGLWLAVAAATGVWFVVLWAAGRDFAAPASGQRQGGSALEDIRLTLSRPGPWLLAACFAFYTLQWLALMVWLPTYLIEQRGSTVLAAATLTVLVIALNIPGNLLGGWLLHRDVPRWALLATVAGLSAPFGLGIFSDLLPDLMRYALCLAFSFLGGMLPAAVLAGAPVFTPTPRQIGATNGLLVQGSHVGQLIGPPAVAAVVAATGDWQAGAWIFVAAGALGVVAALVIRPVERDLVQPAG